MSYSARYSSLRGGGSLAPDHDVKRRWDQIEASQGQLSHTEHHYWLGTSGSYLVTEAVRFYFQRGGSVSHQFNCEGSGGGYVDYWNGN